MSQEAFEKFRERVLEDPSLQQQLRAPADFKEFIPLAIELGRECGLEFSEVDVDAAARASRRAWLERWI